MCFPAGEILTIIYIHCGLRTIQATEITKTHQEQTINKRIHNKSHGGQS